MKVSRLKIYRRVMTCWFHTFIGYLANLFLLFFLVIILTTVARMPVLWLLVFFSAFSLLGIVASIAAGPEIIKKHKLRLIDVNRCKAQTGQFSDLVDVAEELFREAKVRRKPRLYIVPEGLNAFAFTCGIFKPCGIAVSPNLHNILSSSQLKGVLAHELAHIRCRDVGLISTIAVLSCWLRSPVLVPVLLIGPGGLIRAALGFLVVKIASFLFVPITLNAVLQEREEAADALAAKYCGSIEPLKSAFERLKLKTKESPSDNPLVSMFRSHPYLDDRIVKLDELTVQST